MIKKSHLVTACQSNAHLNKKVYSTLLSYQDQNSIDDIKVIKLRGMDVKEQTLPRGLEQHMILDGGLKLNDNIRISDYKIRPNQIRPFTGLDSFAKGNSSFIFGSPKQYFMTVPTLTSKHSKTMATTGVITDPRYDERFRINKIAREDHRYGAIRVDIVDNQLYYQRTLSFQKNGKMIDLCILYDENNQPIRIALPGMVWGDLHLGDHNLVAYQASKNMVQEYEPKKLIIHDFFNGHSINHHEKDDLISLVQRHNRGRDSLEKEVEMCANELKIISNLNFGTTVYIIDSNHNDFLKRYLTEGRFMQDSQNAYFASKILTGTFDGENPLELAINEFIEIPDNVKFTESGESVKIGRYECGQHGHKGTNGSRGSKNTYAKNEPRSVKAHSHEPGSIRDAHTIGTNTNLVLDYNKGGYSSWMQSNMLVYLRSVQALYLINGKYKI